MSDGKERRGFAGLVSLVSDLEEEAARPQAEEIEADEGPPARATETAQAETDDATAGEGAHDEGDSTGFSALSALASEGPAEERPTQRGQAIERDDSRTHSPAGKSADTASPKATSRPAQRPEEHPKPARSEPPRPPQKTSSSRKWLWLVVVAAIAFYVFDATQKGRKPSGDVRSTPQIASKSVAQAPTTQQEGRLSNLTFSVPQTGNENLLNEAELRWCLREGIRIEALEALPETKVKSTEYYDLLLDFLVLCGINRYDKRTLERAQSEVERHRNEIVANVAATWKQSPARTDGARGSQGEESESKNPKRHSVARSLVFETLRETEPKYKDYSDDELGKWLSQTYGPDWLKVLAEQVVAVSRERSGDEQMSTVAEAPVTGPTSRTAQGSAAASSPRPTEQALDKASRAALSAITDGEFPQDASNSESDPVAQAIPDTDAAQDRPVGATASARDTPSVRQTSEEPQRPQEVGRSASERASEEIDQSEPDETARPTEFADGTAHPKTQTVGQASGEAGDSEFAHRGTGTEDTGEPEATMTAGGDEAPPSNWRQLIHEIQMYLTALGYEPGPIDGLYGPKTKRAIEAFERDMGMTPTGEVTIELWRKARGEVKSGTGPQPREETSDATRNSGQGDSGEVGETGGTSDPTNAARRSERTTQDRSGGQDSDTTGASHFTLGSQAEDVLRVQGKPDAVTRYDASGKMMWRYGSSNVEFATPSNRVRQWTNRGKLRVHMRPGPNTTEAPYFTLGSHIDDVLRVQGTPSAITRYDASGKMTWRYGSSTVEISMSTMKVMDWGNRGASGYEANSESTVNQSRTSSTNPS